MTYIDWHIKVILGEVVHYSYIINCKKCNNNCNLFSGGEHDID